jgi:DNA-binding YbaB/EbfC family protein
MNAPHTSKRVTAKGTRPKGQQPGLAEIAARAVAVQEQVSRAKEQAAEQHVVGEAYGGQVRVTIQGDGQPVSVRVAPELLAGDNVDMLDDFLLIAMNEAHTKAMELREKTTEQHLDAIGGIDLKALGLDKVL